MAFKDVMNSRKNGNNEEAYNTAIADYKKNHEDIWAKRALAWCIYDVLKANASYNNRELFLTKLSELRKLDIPDSEELFWSNVVWPINIIVRDCTRSQNNVDKNNVNNILDSLFEIVQELNFAKSAKEYSLLLKAFLTAKEWNGIGALCDWWGFENFHQEDYESEVLSNGRKMPISLAESAYIAYAKELINKKDQEKIKNFLPKIQDLAERYPKMQYPGYYVGKLLLASGSNKQEAVKALLPFVRKKQSDFWAWQLLADTFDNDNDKRMACLLRAVHCHTQEQFLVNIYLILSKAFSQLHYYSDAKIYLDKYLRVKKETQTRVSMDANNMTKENWYSEANGQDCNFKMDYVSITNELLYGDKSETDATVSFVNKDKKVVTVVYGKGKEGFFKYNRFISRLTVGDIIKIRIQEVSADGFMKVYSARVSDNPVNSDYSKSVSGTVTSNQSMTAYFLKCESDSYYIPFNIADRMNLIVGEPISARVIYSYNKKKTVWGWSCIKVNRQDSKGLVVLKNK